MYKLLIKPLLFRMSPERAHHVTVATLRMVLAVPVLGSLLRGYLGSRKLNSPVELFGLHFPNAVGLAAGFDKDGKYMGAMSALGFGFIEIGTVTPRPQAGNPQPRLFRLPEDDALINRMGFNNEGVDALVGRLQKQRPEGLVIGGNIGKNKDTPNEKALDDYAYAFERLFDYVDYFVVNVSSPNTPNLRALQERGPLTSLLQHLQALNMDKAKPKPILLKIAPDLNEAQLNDIIDICQETGMAGIIATNTTISRENLRSDGYKLEKIGAGGLSGRPLRKRSTDIIRYIYNKTQGNLPVIGVGGIASPEDALEKLEAGASLIQIYSGLVYEGPMLISRIKAELQGREFTPARTSRTTLRT